MGNDGGSIPDRRDLVRNKPKAEQADKANQTRARWFFCALSKKPLKEPIVSCALGKLYNKDALLEYLLDRTAYGDGEEICGHIRSLRDVKTLKLTQNPVKSSTSSGSREDVTPFVCPLNFKEMNGSQPFVFIWACGCVFSQAGLRAVSTTPPSSSEQKELDMCPQCGAKYDRAEDILVLNPSPEDEEKMILAMGRRRAAEPTKSKSKGNKKRKLAAQAEDGGPAAKKKHNAAASPAPTTNPSIAAASRAVVSSLAEEEIKRKANMSDAVKSLYQPKGGVQKKETFMTMGTFTRYA